MGLRVKKKKTPNDNIIYRVYLNCWVLWILPYNHTLYQMNRCPLLKSDILPVCSVGYIISIRDIRYKNKNPLSSTFVFAFLMHNIPAREAHWIWILKWPELILLFNFIQVNICQNYLSRTSKTLKHEWIHTIFSLETAKQSIGGPMN